MKEVLPPQVCAAGGISASSCVVREVSIAAVARISSEAIRWAAWPGVAEGGAEEA